MNIRQTIEEYLNERNTIRPNVIKQGQETNVFYYVEESFKNYIISSPSVEALKLLNISELKDLLPKFGKYEIEEFFMNRFLTALFLTRNMTEIFNTTVYCNDFYRPVYFNSDSIKKIFLDIFEIVNESETKVELKLKLKENK